MGKERRFYLRWDVDEEVHCYVEGDRLDAQTLDLSSGGMFLQTERTAQSGSKVVLVFRTQFSAADFPIYLVARVMRRQVKPIRGLGLRWVRATTQGPALQLSLFLRKVLKIQNPLVEQNPVGRKKVVQSCFEFARDLRSLAEEPKGDEAPQQGIRSGVWKLADIPVQVVFSESPRQRRAQISVQNESEGPLTRRTLQNDVLASVDSEAAVVIRGKRYDVRLGYLGLKEAWMTGPNLPGSVGEEVRLAVPVTVRSGTADVHCSCTILSIDLKNRELETALKLRIEDVDEGRNKGVFYSYVRWLHFNAIRGQDT